IAIARALVRKPKLLVLDEATTALDPETEAAICDTICSLAPDVTVFAISHQPAITKVADRTYYLENGKIKNNPAN
ncbi:MAG: ABC transporter ATP-binding protein, partial [Alphaproteobacteria bacterium]|nr:ABC transporter ATP-binding protein [Alphaproteobacteria bacterium]